MQTEIDVVITLCHSSTTGPSILAVSEIELGPSLNSAPAKKRPFSKYA